MQSARLDRRIHLLAPATTRDADYGAPRTSWATVATVWARVTERQAVEDTDAGVRALGRQITVRIRWRSDLRSTWQLGIGTGTGARRLRIKGHIEVGRREWLDLDCDEITGG